MIAKRLISIVAATFLSVSAQAGIIFQDDFNSEATQLNYFGFSNWTVSDGTVDVVADNTYGIRCAGNSGKCVDLDGSTGNAGKLTSSLLALAAGSYTLTFDIRGNQRGYASDSMVMTLGGFLSDSFTLASSDPWQTITRTFTVAGLSTDSIIFNHAGGDNVGIILDNVSVSSTDVPEPATLSLIGLGLVGLGLARRRKV